MAIEFTFLGTSAGAPTKSRNVTALVVQLIGQPSNPQQGWLLVDCGEGTQHQLLHVPYSIHQLAGVLITHMHGDHCFGLPGLLASGGMQRRSQPLDIVGPPELGTFVQTALALSQTTLPYELHFHDVTPVVDRGATLKLGGFEVGAIAMSHRVPSVSYVLQAPPVAGRLDIGKLKAAGVEAGPVWGQLQAGQTVALEDGRVLASRDYLYPIQEGLRLVVGGDNDQPQLLDQAGPVDAVIHEATYSAEVSERVGPFPQHTSALELATWAEQAKVPNLIMTHFSGRYSTDPRHSPHVNELADEAASVYSGRLFLAQDLATYRLSQDRGLTVIPPSR